MKAANILAGILAALAASADAAQQEDTAGAAPPLVEIAEARWASAVDPGSRQPAVLLNDARARRPLVLWMRIRASEAALARLEQAGRLPIRHRWFRDSFAGVQAEGQTEMTDSIVLSAGSRELLAALRQEVSARGHFDWRTWSAKARPGPGRWSVAVVYADHTPVLCDGGKPCRYSITVK